MFKQQIIDQNKQRLNELMNGADIKFGCFNAFCTERATEEAKRNLNNYLLENGVLAPPLMMSEVIYMIIDNDVVKYHIVKIEQDIDCSFRFGAYPCENIKPFTKTKYFKESAIGKTVFQDYTEAVKKVKGEDYYE